MLSHCVLWDTKILLQDTDILLHVWEIFCEISEWWASLANHQPVHTRWPLLPKSSFFSSLTYPDMSLWVEYKREKKTNSSWSSSAARRYSRGRWGCGGQLNYLFKFSKFSTMMIVTKRTAKRELCGLKAGYISGQSGLIITTQPDGAGRLHHNTVTGGNVCTRGFSLTLNGPNQTLQIPGKILPLWILTWPMVWY